MKKLSPGSQNFILHGGEMGTRRGINRTVAQIHALLLLSKQPLRAEVMWFRRGPDAAATGVAAVIPAGLISVASSPSASDSAPWILMWSLAAALWLVFKTLAWVHAGEERPRGKRLLWYSFWPGMDAAAFGPRKALPPAAGAGAALAGPSWRVASLRCLAGITLLFAAARAPLPVLAAGWLGVAGLILTLHFGMFDLLARYWGRAGFPVRPLMDAPWRARSLEDFWGRRWNRGFSDVARFALFRPLARHLGVNGGLLAGFAFSGLAHELVLSVPAGGGDGGPLAYFLLQGGAIWLLRGRGAACPAVLRILLIAAVILAPAYWLFHPPFLERVWLPFLRFVWGGSTLWN